MSVGNVTSAQTSSGTSSGSTIDDKIEKWGKEILDLKTTNKRLLEIVKQATKENNDSPEVLNMIEKFIGQRQIKATAISNMIQAILETMKRIANNIGR